MIFSQGVSYALRVGAFLALQDPTRRFSSAELSLQAHIPKHYCSKILKQLVNADILTSMPGPNGGFAMASHPAEIRFYDLLTAIENDLDSDRCVFGLGTCGDQSPCPLHFRWKEFKETFREWSTASTLQDVIDDVSSIPKLKKYRRK